MAQSKLISPPRWDVRSVRLGAPAAFAVLLAGLALVLALAIDGVRQALPDGNVDHTPAAAARPRPSGVLGDAFLIPAGAIAIVAVVCRRRLAARS